MNPIKVPQGLAGVIIDETKVSKVDPDTNSLIYRGYPVQELCKHCSFEQVAYLLLEGKLLSKEELSKTYTQNKPSRAISDTLAKVISLQPSHTHPMDSIRTAVSFHGSEQENPWDFSQEEKKKRIFDLLEKIPTMIAYQYRSKKGLPLIAPKEEGSLAENFFYMCFGEVPETEIVKAFDTSLILYAEHSFNASTFTSRVVTSTTSDVYSAVTAGIGSLKGPLHGGANEQVMHMMMEIGEVNKAAPWMLQAIKEKKKIMGFGHRVYRKGDSRVPTMKSCLETLSKIKGNSLWLEMYEELEKTMIQEKNIYPNLDFPAGPTYHLMGFDIDFFTPIFVFSRITGWGAHILEQNENNKLIRPLSEYTGESVTSVPPSV